MVVTRFLLKKNHAGRIMAGPGLAPKNPTARSYNPRQYPANKVSAISAVPFAGPIMSSRRIRSLEGLLWMYPGVGPCEQCKAERA
jgi:hypothetical protein